MPTYEYRCPEGHLFELFQRMSDRPQADCPKCGLESERLMSGGAGFLFRGNGFYITDHRSDSYKKDASREEPGSAAEVSAGDNSQESGTPSAPSTTDKGSKSGSDTGGGSPAGET